MTAEEIKNLSDKLEKIKLEKHKAEGALEQLMTSLEKEYNITSEEDIDKEIKRIEKEILEKRELTEDLEQKLRNLVDWESL